MKIIKNHIIDGRHQKPILIDCFFNENDKPKPIVIFAHGYKGFKDWGCWNLVAKQFAENNFFFTKFNFSHNGGTIEQPIDFPDLEAFAENNYTKELDDLQSVIEFILSTDVFKLELDTNNITLIGHSRGGGIVTIKASEDSRVTKLITWASVCDFGKRTATIDDLEEWKKEGVKYVLNGRTKQQMPHNYQFYEDFKANEDRLNIKSATKRLKIPHLIIHGKNDPAVLFNEAESLHQWNSKSILFPIEKANHVFEAKHPWEEKNMPIQLQKVVDESIKFVLLKSKKPH